MTIPDLTWIIEHIREGDLLARVIAPCQGPNDPERFNEQVEWRVDSDPEEQSYGTRTKQREFTGWKQRRREPPDGQARLGELRRDPAVASLVELRPQLARLVDMLFFSGNRKDLVWSRSK